ncbi:hypothetical protein [Ancylomarina longa]|uniref:Uncharacterized protein n=1 Tax=Ancylomarina longa TaxID=2487017 RepID=A0A434AVB0_9BACT|nr:hypothetical protein [Ancylomarina longa]RUT78415.1 hypothetical protein DLK05_08835 [Ancylomarina longa]
MILFTDLKVEKLKPREQIYNEAKEIEEFDLRDLQLTQKTSEVECKLNAVHRFIVENSNLISEDESLLNLIEKVYSDYKCLCLEYEKTTDDKTGELVCNLWFHYKNKMIPLLDILKKDMHYLMSMRSMFIEPDKMPRNLSNEYLYSLDEEELRTIAEEHLQFGTGEGKYAYREIALYFFYNKIEIGENDKRLAKQHAIPDPRELYRHYYNISKGGKLYNRNYGLNIKKISSLLFGTARIKAKEDARLYEKEWNKTVDFLSFGTCLNI